MNLRAPKDTLKIRRPLSLFLVLPTLIFAANSPIEYGFVPSSIGTVATYEYVAGNTGDGRASASVHSIVTITRISADEVRIAARQEGFQPSQPVTAMIRDDGSLDALARSAETATASPTPSGRPRIRHAVPTITDSPVPQQRRVAPAIPEPISETASLLAAAATEGSYPRTWTHALGNGSVPFVLSLSRNDEGTSSTFVADGGGSGNVIHIEATVRGGTFVRARGTLRVVTSNMDQTQTVTTIWSITPVPTS